MVPNLLLSLWNGFWDVLHGSMTSLSQSASDSGARILQFYDELPRNALLPILAVLFVFWPLLLSLVVAFGTAWAWLFWLATR